MRFPFFGGGRGEAGRSQAGWLVPAGARVWFRRMDGSTGHGTVCGAFVPEDFRDPIPMVVDEVTGVRYSPVEIRPAPKAEQEGG